MYNGDYVAEIVGDIIFKTTVSAKVIKINVNK